MSSSGNCGTEGRVPVSLPGARRASPASFVSDLSVQLSSAVSSPRQPDMTLALLTALFTTSTSVSPSGKHKHLRSSRCSRVN